MKISKNIKSTILSSALLACCLPTLNAAEVNGWGDFKLFIDPGHSQTENRGLYNYSEAEKVLSVALNIRDFLQKYTDIPAENIKLCRETDEDYISLSDRTDVANAWGADFYYSIHSDAGDGSTPNTTVTLFGGWMNNGQQVEKTPNGGKAYGDILNPNLSSVMGVETRGNYYDRCFYYKGEQHHEKQYPYLHVNRETTMPSLLSEGGYHTNSFQQQRNLNANYKRLEAYAAFRSILKYRGLSLPVQPLLVGVAKNSENQVPINGLTIEVGGQKVVTDDYKTLFKKYTKNPNMLHNGFFMFENLEPNKEYTVVFSSKDFGRVEKKVTMKSTSEGVAADNVTWLNVELTSIAPAKVDQISAADLNSVKMREPLSIVFSRNMDKASVEKAFSIDKNAQVKLSWVNEYTLNVDITALEHETQYTIKIDGTIAKNSQTQQMLDGNGDGKEGGNYILKFKTEPLDETAPEIVSVDPAIDGEATYTYRPVIRIEFSEEVVFNEDKAVDIITVKDSDNKTYAGAIKHEVVGGASVLHFMFNEDIPMDKCFMVTFKGGLSDLNGNVCEPFSWKFLSEYRPEKESIFLKDLDTADGWWAPAGSGSTAGTLNDDCSWKASTKSHSKDSAGSCCLTYLFDETAASPLWQIREYCKAAEGIKVGQNIDGVLKFWLFGDGSNNRTSVMIRANKGGGGLKHKVLVPINFKGWKHITWDLKNEPYEHFTGTEELTRVWILDSFFLKHEDTLLTPDEPQQAWSGQIYYDDLYYTIYDQTATRKATLDDMGDGSVEEIEAADVCINQVGDELIVGGNNIEEVTLFNAAGSIVLNTTSKVIDLSELNNGLYIVKVTTADSKIVKKIIK